MTTSTLTVSPYHEINNLMSRIGQTADYFINSGETVTANDLSPLFTQDALWYLGGDETKGLDKISKLWNDVHATFIFGRHRYLQRIIEQNQNNQNIYNAKWYLDAIFTTSEGIDWKGCGPYSGTFIKCDDNKFRCCSFTVKLDYWGPANKSLQEIASDGSSLKKLSKSKKKNKNDDSKDSK